MSDEDWRFRAACATADPDWWTPIHPTDRSASWAAHVCLGCPVRKRCDKWASEHPRLVVGGVYAGVYYSAGGAKQKVPPLPHDGRTRVEWGKLPIDRIAELAGLGCTDKEIAAAIGSTVDSVQKTRQKHRIVAGRQARKAA